jgi:uncharacterized protein
MKGAATAAIFVMNNRQVETVRPVEAVRENHRRMAAWPYLELDVAELRTSGWRPTPVRDLVLKIHQRCNLACDYCYVYTQADQSWRRRPAVMSEEIWRATIANLDRHVRAHRLPAVRVILHGGEPLLFGTVRLERLVTELRAGLPSGCAVEVGLQTNGVLLSEAMVTSLRTSGVSVGVSVDGTAADHDRHRVTRRGRGSFAAVQAALELLCRPENRSVYAGLLCTVSPETDPQASYDQLVAFDPPSIDFLLPHANWDDRPHSPGTSPTPYADWLIAVFDRWYGVDDAIRVRLFDDIIGLLIGAPSGSEQVGLSPSAVLVIESDGAIEQVDALKSAYPEACATGLDVRHDSFDDALADPGIIARQIGWAALPAQCHECPVFTACGGGHYAHRYNRPTGFRNPTVYCDDMKRLIHHIRRRVSLDVEQRLTSRT